MGKNADVVAKAMKSTEMDANALLDIQKPVYFYRLIRGYMHCGHHPTGLIMSDGQKGQTERSKSLFDRC